MSKYLSLILRHKPELIGITLEADGWANVEDILKGMKITMKELENIVKNDNKKRYSFNANKTKIKANQGHSVEIDILFKKEIPPNILYHGTSLTNKEKILKDGILKMKRHHVHLSKDITTAIIVGKRHGKEIVIFKIDTVKMVDDNIDFYLSDNDVWLTDYVDPKFLEVN
jgi:putative RNA 2'-phosphotransferase